MTPKDKISPEARASLIQAFQVKDQSEIQEWVLNELGIDMTSNPDLYLANGNMLFNKAFEWINVHLEDPIIIAKPAVKKPRTTFVWRNPANVDRILAWATIIVGALGLLMPFIPNTLTALLMIGLLAYAVIRSTRRLDPQTWHDFRTVWLGENLAEFAALVGVVVYMIGGFEPSSYFVPAFILFLEGLRHY